ncbi:unnamed protein product, partial [Phaeothamnion confervicola]
MSVASWVTGSDGSDGSGGQDGYIEADNDAEENKQLHEERGDGSGAEDDDASGSGERGGGILDQSESESEDGEDEEEEESDAELDLKLRGAREQDLSLNIHDQLNLAKLRYLRQSFFTPDGSRRELDLQAFLEAFKGALDMEGVPEDDLCALFMKIDANSNGGVDWDEFTDYIVQLDEGNRKMAAAEAMLDLVPDENFERGRRESSGGHRGVGSGAGGSGGVGSGSKVATASKAAAASKGMAGVIGCTDIAGGGGAGGHHRDMIERIINVERPGLSAYITCGRDGTIRFWNKTTFGHMRCINHLDTVKAHYQRVVQGSAPRDDVDAAGIAAGGGGSGGTGRGGAGIGRHRGATPGLASVGKMSAAWLCDICVMSLGSRLAVACLDRSVAFYDFLTGEPVCRIADLASPPTCVECTQMGPDTQTLVFGDLDGGLHFWDLGRSFQITSSGAANGAAATAAGGGGCSGGGGGGCTGGLIGGIDGAAVTAAGAPGAAAGAAAGRQARGGGGGGSGGGTDVVGSCYVAGVHGDAVTRVRVVADLAAVVTSALDGTVRLTCLHKRHVLRSFTGHVQGVRDFVYCPMQRCVASVGVNREALVWNPYTLDVLARLEGHAAAVTLAVFDEANARIMTFAADKSIRVWDASTCAPLQSFAVPQRFRPDDTVTAALWDPARSTLVAAGNRFVVWRNKGVIHMSTRSHDAPVCAALYNSGFRQVVSGDAAGIISIWTFETGQMAFRYTVGGSDGGDDGDVGGNCNAKITALCFDGGGRRLVVGANDGTLRVWNFSNGQVLRTLERGDRRASPDPAFVTTDDGGDVFALRGGSGREVSGVVYMGDGGGHSGHGSLSGISYIASCSWDRLVRLYIDDDAAPTLPEKVMPPAPLSPLVPWDGVPGGGSSGNGGAVLPSSRPPPPPPPPGRVAQLPPRPHTKPGARQERPALRKAAAFRSPHAASAIGGGTAAAASEVHGAPRSAWQWHWQGHHKDILCLAHCGAQQLASGGADGDVILWDPETGGPRWRARPGDHPVSDYGDDISSLGWLSKRSNDGNRRGGILTDAPRGDGDAGAPGGGSPD